MPIAYKENVPGKYLINQMQNNMNIYGLCLGPAQTGLAGSVPQYWDSLVEY